MKKLLIIDGDSRSAEALKEHLRARMSVSIASTGAEGLRAAESGAFPVIILELKLPDMDGLKLMENIRGLNESVFVIAVTSAEEMEITVEAIKKGAFDFMQKPVDTSELDLSIKKIFRSIELHRSLSDLVDEYGKYKFDAIIGKSRAMEEIFKTIGIASQCKVTILIQGESGTGKELIARAIHYNSPEREKPFIAINCSALVETLLESELFGHEKGAFTGALFKKEGKFEVANGGTVFLDEIGEMSPQLQVKLLRVLQERTFERVGGSDCIKTDVRVIAATNTDLQELISKGLFREDLFYRLKVITIEVPPLRERKEDIPLLIIHLLEKANRELHKKVRKVPEKTISRMMDYPWPGNVRELENVITRGVLLSKGDVLMDVYLPGAAHNNGKPFVPVTLDEAEREHVRKVLEYTGWNKSRAAVLLGIPLPRLDRKIKKYGLVPRV